MNIKNILQDDFVVSFLHEVLTDEKTANEPSVVAPSGELYRTNQYMMLTVIESLIRYQIIMKEDQDTKRFLTNLKRQFHYVRNYKDIILLANYLIAEEVRNKLNLKEMESKESIRKIVDFIYHNYIEEGYCFHAFPSTFVMAINEEGLYPERSYGSLDLMRQVNQIFKGYHYSFFTQLDQPIAPAIYITDSPAMAYFYGMQTPEYFSKLLATSNAYHDAEKYDFNAYYRKDKRACMKNVENFCNELALPVKEKSVVMRYVIEEWNNLDASMMEPCVAFIKRSAIGRNQLKEYDVILEQAGSEDIVYTISKITESRFPRDKRYTKILPFEFDIVKMPSYNKILKQEVILDTIEEVVSVQEEVTLENLVEDNLEVKENQLVVENVSNKVEEDYQKNQKVNLGKAKPQAGYADIVALTGLFCITLGLTITIIVNYFH